jgi:hypothetical protein
LKFSGEKLKYAGEKKSINMQTWFSLVTEGLPVRNQCKQSESRNEAITTVFDVSPLFLTFSPQLCTISPPPPLFYHHPGHSLFFTTSCAFFTQKRRKQVLLTTSFHAIVHDCTSPPPHPIHPAQPCPTRPTLSPAQSPQRSSCPSPAPRPDNVSYVGHLPESYWQCRNAVRRTAEV